MKTKAFLTAALLSLLPLAEKWSLLSEVKFNALSQREGHTPEAPLPDRNYFSVRMGILRNF